MCFCQNGHVYAISINISLRSLPGRFFFVEKGLKGWLTPRNTEPPRSGRFQPGWQSLDRRQHIELLLSLRPLSCSDLQRWSLPPSSWLETCFQHSLSTRWQVALPWASEWTIFCLKLQFSLCSMNYLEGFVKHTPMPWIYMSFIEILQAKTTSWCRNRLCFTAILVICRIKVIFLLNFHLLKPLWSCYVYLPTQFQCAKLFFFSKIIGCTTPHPSNTARPCSLLLWLMSLSTKGGKNRGRSV